MTKTRTTTYHLQCDGLVKSANKITLNVLSKYVADNQRGWDLKVGYHAAFQIWTGVSSFELLYGREARTPAAYAYRNPGDAPVEPSEHLEELTRRTALKDITKAKLVETQAKQKECYDEQTSDALTFDERDVVYLHIPRERRGQTKKLSRLWKGPFVVKHIYDAVDAKNTAD